ncbi:IS200/IS605 family transposase [Sporosarcina jiandibaonis]|uniref:IS200/IS605 family transposase n=1 Tax=Sporosarcina jiandibaonis TaxID=2715535 RepID=UPI0015544830|nr:IS200/IS605 family transposase [Sporosarcina jiandibaonis]
MKLDSNNHSVFSLNFHLVLVIKYRKKVLDDKVSDFLKSTFARIAENHNIHLTEWNHDRNHIHVLFRSHPNTNLSKFINAYKSASSRLVKQDFPGVKTKLYKESFWSQSFCLISPGGTSIDVIKEYIQKQGK